MFDAQTLVRSARKYNPTDDFLLAAYGLSSSEKTDAIVLAPSWTPEKILCEYNPKIEILRQNANIDTSIVEFSGHRIGWIHFGVGACNMMDAALSLAESAADRLIFVGSVGALRPEIPLGALITPQESYSYDSSSIYLREGLDASNFGRTVLPHRQDFIDRVLSEAAGQDISVSKKRVFCTDSVVCEYSKLDTILATGAEAIEMETAAFYECARLIDKAAVALLCVSDNSACGIGLIGRSEEDTQRYYRSRYHELPKLIEIACSTPL